MLVENLLLVLVGISYLLFHMKQNKNGGWVRNALKVLILSNKTFKKEIYSSILSVSMHPSGMAVALGSADQ